jgi:hypothetical protein
MCVERTFCECQASSKTGGMDRRRPKKVISYNESDEEEEEMEEETKKEGAGKKEKTAATKKRKIMESDDEEDFNDEDEDVGKKKKKNVTKTPTPTRKKKKTSEDDDDDDEEEGKKKKRKSVTPAKKAKVTKRKGNDDEEEDDDGGEDEDENEEDDEEEEDEGEEDEDENDDERPKRSRLSSSSATSRKPRKSSERTASMKVLTRFERLEEARKAYKWWEAEDLPHGVNWRQLEHPGILFPAAYVSHHVPLLYDGQPVELTVEQEEIATFYAAIPDDGPQLGNPKTRQVFQQNFFVDFKATLGTGHVIKKFEKCDFSRIKDHLALQKSIKKAATDEEKLVAKKDRESQALKYGYALIDGRIEKV